MCDLELDCVRKPSKNRKMLKNISNFVTIFPQDYLSYLNVSEEVRITLFGIILQHQNLSGFLRHPINCQTVGCLGYFSLFKVQ